MKHPVQRYLFGTYSKLELTASRPADCIVKNPTHPPSPPSKLFFLLTNQKLNDCKFVCVIEMSAFRLKCVLEINFLDLLCVIIVKKFQHEAE
jgi:hypothetical protein